MRPLRTPTAIVCWSRTANHHQARAWSAADVYSSGVLHRHLSELQMSEISLFPPPQEVQCSSHVPPDALWSQRLKKPSRLAERDVVQVLVEHVVSPGCFYVSFCDSEEARTTEDMMIEMRWRLRRR